MDIQQAIDALTQALGPTGQWVWATMRTGLIRTAWIELAVGLLLLVNAALYIRFLRPFLVPGDISDAQGLTCIVWGFISCCALIIGIATFEEAIPRLLSPDYYTLRTILGR